MIDMKHLNYYVLKLLNSKLLSEYLSEYLSKISTPFRGGFWSCNWQYLERLPIVIPTAEHQADIDKIQAMVQQIVMLKNRQRGKKLQRCSFSGKRA
jgi:hypothetical protein